MESGSNQGVEVMVVEVVVMVELKMVVEVVAELVELRAVVVEVEV